MVNISDVETFVAECILDPNDLQNYPPEEVEKAFLPETISA